MKDRQVEPSPPQMRIPLVSSTLHCVSMTVIVFLRSSFGFVYLRPKSLFFAFTWAFTLFFIYARAEKEVWAEYRFACFFGIGAVVLYYSHLVSAFISELRREGSHDYDSGTPHLVRILRGFGASPTVVFEMRWQLWAEPLLVAIAAVLLRLLWGEEHLSAWLFFVAPCLFLKECLNYWFQIRQRKRHHDSRDDAEDIFDQPDAPPQVEAPKPVGKAKVKRARASAMSAEDEVRERQFAQILRLMPPFVLEEAETNYRKLIRQYHPDPNADRPENQALTAELNEAIAYFRSRKS